MGQQFPAETSMGFVAV